MSRRRSIYKLPKLKLKQRTITAVASLIALILAVLSIVSLTTHSETLTFWRDFLSETLGWTKIIAPIIFVLSGLVLSKVKWKFAQTNVLLGLILIILSLSSLIISYLSFVIP